MFAKKKESCPTCSSIETEFLELDYWGAIKLMRKSVEIGKLEFVAGDCPIQDIEKEIEAESQYTYYHYFQCKCGKCFNTGVCIRSSAPIIKVLEGLPDNYMKKLNSRFGSRFE